MYLIKNNISSDIENVYIKFSLKENYFTSALNTNVLLDISIWFVEEKKFRFHCKLVDSTYEFDGNVDIFIVNKNCKEEFTKISMETLESEWAQIYDCSFVLRPKISNHTFQIPRIIHQSYKSELKYRNYLACSSWKMLNPHYEYKYWTDEEAYTLIKNNFDSKVLDAYEMLYAGAYKADIFRLCVLYLYGGVWIDISAQCEEPIDDLIEKDMELLIVEDTPSQIEYPNIYQAFIIATKNCQMIKHVLNFTVDRVIRHARYEFIYPFFKINTISVTGPNVFAIALNDYYGLFHGEFWKEGYYKTIKIIKHPGTIISTNGKKVITTKYPNHKNDRTNLHYSSLFSQGYVFKEKIDDVWIDGSKPTIFQIWINSRFVSKKMSNAINSWKKFHSDWNYTLHTGESLLLEMSKSIEFPNILEKFNQIRPYAFKSDIGRLFLLYHYGGLYSDIDTICYTSCQQLHHGYDLVLCRDMDRSSIANGFMMSKKHNLFIKYLLEKILLNISTDKNYESPLEITGPTFIGQILGEFFGLSPPFQTGDYKINNYTIKILEYSRHLPLPKGNWYESCKDTTVHGNILKTRAKRIDDSYKDNVITFHPGDQLQNHDGKLIGHQSFEYIECPGSGLIFDSTKVYLNSKYDGYNEERLILGGNNFAEMFDNGQVLKGQKTKMDTPTPIIHKKTILIGVSDSNTKIIDCNEPIRSYRFNLADNPWPDRFEFTVQDSKLIIKRLDHPCGWGYNHSVNIEWTESKIKFIKIFGERNSGTTFLEKLFPQNLVDIQVNSGHHHHGTGWKHGFPDLELFNLQDTLFVFVVRDLEPWIKSMFCNPYHYKSPQTIEEFIEKPLIINEKDKTLNVHNDSREQQTILEIRYSKIKTYMKILKNKEVNGIIINLEDLQTDNGQYFIEFLCNTFDLSRKNKFHSIDKHTKTNKNYLNRSYLMTLPDISFQKNERIEDFVLELKHQNYFYNKSVPNIM